MQLPRWQDNRECFARDDNAFLRYGEKLLERERAPVRRDAPVTGGGTPALRWRVTATGNPSMLLGTSTPACVERILGRRPIAFDQWLIENAGAFQ
jgi:hypothetical protein